MKKLKTPHVRSTFGSCDVEKVHAVVARSTLRSQNVQNTPCSEVEMPKKMHAVVAHFEVKMLKTPGIRTIFGSCDVEKMQAIVARSTCRSQNVKNTRVSDHFCKSKQNVRALCHFQLQPPLHSTTLQLQLQLHLDYIPLQSTTLHYTTFHYTTLHYTTLHYTTLHSTTLH